jgi:hypothetical protein
MSPCLQHELQRKPVCTDFEDLMGSETGLTLPGFVVGTDQANL